MRRNTREHRHRYETVGHSYVSLAFVMMAVSSALWACMQRYAQYTAGVNHLGFLSIDQIYSTPYVVFERAVREYYPLNHFTFSIFQQVHCIVRHLISIYPMNRILLWQSDRDEALTESLVVTWKQSFDNYGKERH